VIRATLIAVAVAMCCRWAFAQVLRITIGRFGDPVKPDNRLPRSGSGLGRASMV
jgi:hypothetical protein